MGRRGLAQRGGYQAFFSSRLSSQSRFCRYLLSVFLVSGRLYCEHTLLTLDFKLKPHSLSHSVTHSPTAVSVTVNFVLSENLQLSKHCLQIAGFRLKDKNENNNSRARLSVCLSVCPSPCCRPPLYMCGTIMHGGFFCCDFANVS